MVTVDPHMAEILKLVAEQNLPGFECMTAQEARATAEERNRFWNEDNPPVGEVRELDVPGPGGPMRLRLYVPSAAGPTSPGVLYIHGGGWVICSLDTHDGVCRRLANASGLRVASLDYRMAPEHPFPAPLDDCIAAARWLHGHGRELGIDPARIALAGDSAGANLSLAALLALRDSGEPLPLTAALIYGAYEFGFSNGSHQTFGGGDYILSAAAMRWFTDHYLPDPELREHPLAAPLRAELSGLPPLYLSAAELDPLRDDTDKLAARLAEAGVDFDYRLWRGVTHACIMFSRMLPAADRQLAEIGDFLRRRLAA